MIKRFYINNVTDDHRPVNLISHLKISKKELEDLKYYVENGYYPIIIVHDNEEGIQLNLPFSCLSTSGELTGFFDEEGIPKDAMNIAYFGNITNLIVDGSDDVVVFDMDNMVLIYGSFAMGIVPNNLEYNARKAKSKRRLRAKEE